MEAAPLVTLIAVALAIIVIALFLVTVTYQLHQVTSRLNVILGAVGDVGDTTAALEPVIEEIAGDLMGADEAMHGAVERLKERKGYTAEPVTGVGTLAQPAPWQSVPAGPPPTTFSR